MTNKLFLNDCYLEKFTAKIIGKTSSGIILDKTAFYPEGGGQLGDMGVLQSGKGLFKVVNTYQKEGNIIHELSSIEGLNVGMMIDAKLDWNRRYQQMRGHTAQHVISRFFQINYKAETVGNQLKMANCRLDLYPMDKITSDELLSVSAEINKIISRNMPVTISYLSRKEAIEFLKKKEYQTKYLNMVPNSVKEFRIISIDEYDWAACAGTHVNNTSEIGKISLDQMKNKGKSRERVIYSLIS